MRDLAINRRTISLMKNEIEYEVEKNTELSNSNHTFFTFKTTVPHGMSSGDKIILEKAFIRPIFYARQHEGKYTNTTQREFEVNVVDEQTFTIAFENYELVEVKNHALVENNAILEILSHNMYECVNDVNNFIIKSMGVEYIGKRGFVQDSKTGEEIDELYLTSKCIVFEKPIPYLNNVGSVFVKNTWHLKDDNETFDDENIFISDNGEYMTTSIPLSTSISYKSTENNVFSNILQEVREMATPQIIDNEKRQFMPAIAQGNNLKLAQGIEFNLHFRDRYDLNIPDGEKEKLTLNWSTTDEQLWNGFVIDDTTNCLKRKYEGFTDDNADELCDLGFTEDDIRFRKTKLKKSFLRLSFYSSKDVLDRNLLFYSTIFLDSGELFSIYSNIKNYKRELNSKANIAESAFDKTRTNDKLRLSAKLNVYNKYNVTKSSEGFYLYLFPDEVEGESKARTIYMKAEFNHAGYGKTVTMMLPRKRYYNDKINYNITNPPLKSDDDDFPITFLKNENGKVDNDYERYTDSVMIPVNIIFDKTKGCYVYFFPWYDRAQENKIIINLWEPRIRG